MPHIVPTNQLAATNFTPLAVVHEYLHVEWYRGNVYGHQVEVLQKVLSNAIQKLPLVTNDRKLTSSVQRQAAKTMSINDMGHLSASVMLTVLLGLLSRPRITARKSAHYDSILYNSQLHVMIC